MAHLWLQDTNHRWLARPLAGPEVNLRSFLAAASEVGAAASLAPPDVSLMQTSMQDPAEWVILAGHNCGIAVNGIPLVLGIRALADRDDIRWSPVAFAFYSTEELAAATALPEGDRKLFCPRCKQEIAAGSPAVRCPRCGIWHHQSEQLPCYTYAERCATCARKTSLDCGYDWTPEGM